MKKIYLMFSFSALIFILLGCGGRDTDNVEEALLGHWVDEDTEESHIYYDSDTITMIAPQGTREEFDYVIRRANDNEGFIEIETSRPNSDDTDLVRMFFLDEDRTTMRRESETFSQIAELIGMEEEEEIFIYESNNRTP